MSRLFTKRLSSNYSTQISTSRKITNWSTLTNNPRRNDINNDQNKRSVLDTNRKTTCEKNNYKRYKCKIFNISHQNHLVVGTDYARLFIYKTKGKRDIKVHLLLINCSLTRVVHPEILLNQTTQEFIQTLKQLIARRDRPKIIYSDNAKHLRKLQSRSRKFSKTRECNIF